jgi:dihydrofolate reductase
MGKVIADISMSLDGFVTGPDQTPEEPLGKGGEQLHEWAFGQHDGDRELAERAAGELGALVCGRTTYDDSLPWWEADGPTGARRLPLCVVTHRAPEESPEDGVYTFVTDGISKAVELAQEAAGGRDVAIMGGADLIQQCLAAGLVDEIGIHLVPVLFGGGTRLFVDAGHQRLEPLDAVRTPAAVHLRFGARG